MSNLLSDAIVDAKALREAALKSAETAVIEKYSSEVKKTLDQLLEQDDLDLNLGADAGDIGMEPAADLGMPETTAPSEPIDEEDNIPLAATDNFSELEGKNLEDFPAAGEPVELTLDLGALQEAVQALSDSEEVEINEADFVGVFSEENGDEDDEVNEYGGHQGRYRDSEAAYDKCKLVALNAGMSPEEAHEKCNKEHPRYVGENLISSIIDKILNEVDKDGDGAPAAPKWSKEPGKKAPKWADKDDDDPDVGDDLGEAVAVAADDAAVGSAEEADAETKQFKNSGLEEMDLDELADEIMEKLTVDMGATLSGWAGRSSEDQKWEMEKALAHRRSTDVEEDLKNLKKAHDELVFENNQISERNNQYKQVVEELRESLHDVNLSNARLLYTNRVLRNSSLNERQKEKIVEAISNAGSVTEAKTIYETLQSTVEAKPKRSPQSLSEAISNRSSVIRATRKESPSIDPLQDRMKRLAGIK